MFSRVRLFATPWTAARQASLSITSSQSLLKLMSVESVMPSTHLILCCPLLLPPSGFPSIRVCSNESVLLSLLVYPVHRRLVLSTPRRLHVEPLSFRFTFLSVQVFRRQIVSGFVCLKCFLFSLWGKKKKVLIYFWLCWVLVSASGFPGFASRGHSSWRLAGFGLQ